MPRAPSASNEGDELAGEATEPVEVEDDEDVAATQIVETRRQVGPIGRGAGGVILEHALAADGVERVELAIEDLAPFGGGDAGVADEAHGVCGPEKPFTPAFCCKEISSRLSGRKIRPIGGCGGVCGRVTTITGLSRSHMTCLLCSSVCSGRHWAVRGRKHRKHQNGNKEPC